MHRYPALPSLSQGLWPTSNRLVGLKSVWHPTYASSVINLIEWKLYSDATATLTKFCSRLYGRMRRFPAWRCRIFSGSSEHHSTDNVIMPLLPSVTSSDVLSRRNYSIGLANWRAAVSTHTEHSHRAGRALPTCYILLGRILWVQLLFYGHSTGLVGSHICSATMSTSVCIGN